MAVATFLSNLGGGITATNLVGSQLSPDGRRVVLSVGTKGPQGGERLGLVIIDLASGNMFNLTTDPPVSRRHAGLESRWQVDRVHSPFRNRWKGRRDLGDRAAGWFTRSRTIPSCSHHGGTALSCLRMDARRHVARDVTRQRPLRIRRRSPGPAVPARAECAARNIADMHGDVYEGRDSADWRRAAPQFAGVFVENPRGGTQTIQVADAAAAPRRVVVQNANANALLQRPRWRPCSDEFLYLETQIATGPRTTHLKIADARTGAQREAFARQDSFWAEWTPAGDEIAWVRGRTASPSTVRLVRPDGSGGRAIYGTGGIPEGTGDHGGFRYAPLLTGQRQRALHGG